MTRDELRLLIREVVAEATVDLREEIKDLAAADPTMAPSSTEQMTVTNGMLTEKTLRAAGQKNIEVVEVSRSVLVTPLARDAARSKGIRIVRID